MRFAALLFVIGCGGDTKPSATPVSNTSGASDPTPPPSTTVGDARVVQRTQAGGVIELVGDREGAMQTASKHMSAHCGPDNYTITQEGEEVVGTDTLAGPNASGATVRTDTAWRVHYQCFGSP